MIHGWECRGSLAMWLAVLVVDGDLCFCFRFCSLHLICRASLMALLHHTYIPSYPYPLEIYLGHAPWTCTLDMYLGHAPRHLGCHVPYLVPPWGMHAAPRTDTLESNVGSEDTLGPTLFGDASAEG